MCGIGGVLRFDGAEVDLGLLRRMAGSLAHRGPDDEGVYTAGPLGLVNRRLAVLDPTPQGHQPMGSPDGSLWLTHNGEIYNYQELRAELSAAGRVFKTGTDTEVILAAFEAWGIACLERFVGMFAFALWDARDDTLWLARDRLGIKPLHYACDGQRLVFASEIKTLFLDGDVHKEMRAEAFAEYLAYTHPLERDTTWFKDVHTVPPGCYGRVNDGRLEVTSWWDPVDCYRRSPAEGPDLVHEVREQLEDAVTLHVRSDVSLGAYLSGGLDSSLVVGLVAETLPDPVWTFSGAFAEGERYDERRYVRLVVDRWHTVHHEVVPDDEAFRHDIGQVAWQLDEPSVGVAAFSQYEVCRLVKDSGVKVVNGGQGGDEVFGGYPRYLRHTEPGWAGALRQAFDLPVMKAHVRRRLYDGSFGRRVTGLHPDLARRLGDFRPTRPSALADPVADAMYFDLRYYLPALLQVEDRMSMAMSIESRLPLLDHRLVELAASIPSSTLMPDGRLKGLLRQSVADVVPTEIVERRDKAGFPTPFGPWVRGPLGGWARDLLLGPDFTARRVFAPRYLRALLDLHQKTPLPMTYPLWVAVSVALWFEAFDPGIDW
ncbi:MAG TPA: asparagine synthase (glutamine-hydrolyzing) [Acidimicrobiales bacterium]|nr:asparagine synthase (glutamine-hydrolyzing) [Acidimicrobiales bacterium]